MFEQSAVPHINSILLVSLYIIMTVQYRSNVSYHRRTLQESRRALQESRHALQESHSALQELRSAMKKKLQVHYVGLLRDLNWPFVIIFEKGTQLIEYPLRSEPISLFRLPSYHAIAYRSLKKSGFYTQLLKLRLLL